MALEYERLRLAQLNAKQDDLERLARKYLATATAENEKALAKLREQDEALLAPYQAPARDPAGHFEAAPGTPTDERAQFARNKANMLAGLRGAE